MEMDREKFMEKLKGLVELAKKKKNVLENQEVKDYFQDMVSKIFTKMGIDTQDVLEAASTKWNFLPFKPGLVGGTCIGVDPYYLAQ